jgi:hypothetical protein
MLGWFEMSLFLTSLPFPNLLTPQICNIAQMFLNYENPTVKDLGIPPKGMCLNLGEYRSKNASPPHPRRGFFCLGGGARGGGGGLIMVCPGVAVSYTASFDTKLQILPSTPGSLSWTCSSGGNRHGPVSSQPHYVGFFFFMHVFVPFISPKNSMIMGPFLAKVSDPIPYVLYLFSIKHLVASTENGLLSYQEPH